MGSLAAGGIEKFDLERKKKFSPVPLPSLPSTSVFLVD